MSSTPRNEGFTLIEVLVSLALLVVISGALYGTFFSLTRGRDAAVEKMEGRRELSSTLDLLRRELSAALYKPGEKRLRFVVEDRDYFGRPASVLDFTALAPPLGRGAPVSDQIEVIYRAEEKGRRLFLKRGERDIYASADPLHYPRMGEVEGFLVECHDGEKWVRTWDTALNGRLPGFIRVTIGVREGERTVNYSAIARPRIGS